MRLASWHDAFVRADKLPRGHVNVIDAFKLIRAILVRTLAAPRSENNAEGMIGVLPCAGSIRTA